MNAVPMAMDLHHYVSWFVSLTRTLGKYLIYYFYLLNFLITPIARLTALMIGIYPWSMYRHFKMCSRNSVSGILAPFSAVSSHIILSITYIMVSVNLSTNPEETLPVKLSCTIPSADPVIYSILIAILIFTKYDPFITVFPVLSSVLFCFSSALFPLFSYWSSSV